MLELKLIHACQRSPVKFSGWQLLLNVRIWIKPNFRTTCKKNPYFNERDIIFLFGNKCPCLSKFIHSVFQLGEVHGFDFETDSDGEVFIHLYTNGGAELMAKSLDGVFSFCMVDTTKGKVFIGRDTFGVRPSFWLSTDNGMMAVCSEVKGELMWYLWNISEYIEYSSFSAPLLSLLVNIIIEYAWTLDLCNATVCAICNCSLQLYQLAVRYFKSYQSSLTSTSVHASVQVNVQVALPKIQPNSDICWFCQVNHSVTRCTTA